MQLYLGYMLQRKFRTWKILVALTFLTLFAAKFLPLNQLSAEMLFYIAFLLGCLVAIHGINIILLIVQKTDRQMLTVTNRKSLYMLLEHLDNIEDSV